jgi:hypothetical protein
VGLCGLMRKVILKRVGTDMTMVDFFVRFGKSH